MAAAGQQYTIEECCFRSTGERLCHFRKMAGLSMLTVAQMTGISRAELSRLEAGTRILSHRHLLLLSDVYGISVHTIKSIIAYDPAKNTPSGSPDSGPTAYFPRRNLCSLPLKHADGTERAEQNLQLDIALPLSEAAYCVRTSQPVEAGPDEWNSLVIVDPKARTLIGDMVMAECQKRLTCVYLGRNDLGGIVGSWAGADGHQLRQGSATSRVPQSNCRFSLP